MKNTHVIAERSIDTHGSAPSGQHRGSPGSWATDPSTSLEEKLRRWALQTCMKQRGITWQDVQDELGLTKARVGQLFSRANKSDKHYARIEAAIERITERRHAALHTDSDVNCSVYTVCDPDDRLVKAKLGALEDWRNRG